MGANTCGGRNIDYTRGVASSRVFRQKLRKPSVRSEHVRAKKLTSGERTQRSLCVFSQHTYIVSGYNLL